MEMRDKSQVASCVCLGPALLLLITCVAIVAHTEAANSTTIPLRNPWEHVHEPSAHATEIRGGYTGGCLHGAQSILHDQGDFLLMRVSRRRYFSHPDMRAFINDVAGIIKRDKLGTLLVGDVSQPRGGPSLSGHASHQVGLDADVWFWLDAPAETQQLGHHARGKISAVSMLNDKRNGLHAKRLGTLQIAVLKLAAEDSRVQRIFVNPHIKKELCRVTDKATWLKKIRPWWGHHYHFHIRLMCPEREPQCRAQAAVPKGAECGDTLAWWFSKEAADTLRERMKKERQKTNKQRLEAKLAKLPGNCAEVLRAP